MDLLKIRKKAREQKEADAAREKEKEPAGEPVSVQAGAAPGEGRSEHADQATANHPSPPGETPDAEVRPEPPAGERGPESPPVPEAEPGSVEPPAPAYVEYLAFMLSDEEYAVKVEDVKEIIRWQKITAVPRAPGFVMGVISLRGVIIPVFDLKRRLGLGEAGRSRHSRVLVVSDKGSLQGVMVDRVTGVVKLGPEGIEPPPSVIGGVEAGYLEGVGRLGERLLILFDTPKVLSM